MLNYQTYNQYIYINKNEWRDRLKYPISNLLYSRVQGADDFSLNKLRRNYLRRIVLYLYSTGCCSKIDKKLKMDILVSKMYTLNWFINTIHDGENIHLFSIFSDICYFLK